MASKMHAIWMIPDLTALIMQELARKDQVRLLQVSWLLLEAAASMVWRSIYLTQIGDLFDVDSGQLKHKGEGSQVARCGLYAQSVRQFWYFSPSVASGLAINAFIIKHGLVNLLPNVRHVTTEMSAESNRSPPADIVRSLAGSKLETLSLALSRAFFASPIISTFVSSVSPTADLKSLTLLDVPLAPDADVQQLFDQQKTIRLLKVRCAPREIVSVWQGSGSLSELQAAEFDTYVQDCDPGPTLPRTSGFRSLIKLRLILPASELLSSFLSTVTSPHLRFLEIGCGRGDLIGTAIDTVHRFENLVSLELHWKMGRLSWDLSKPWQAHTGIQRLVISGRGVPTRINDVAIERLALVFPRLQELKITSPDRNNCGTGVTLEGLDALARHCISLKKLHICIDTTQLDEERRALPDVRGLALVELNLRNSILPINAREELAEYLSELWPNHRFRAVTWQHPDIKQKWEEVFELVKTKLEQS